VDQVAAGHDPVQPDQQQPGGHHVGKEPHLR
jgi:hypothetical protein